MKTIYAPDPGAAFVLRGQERKPDTEYRYLTYVIPCEIKDGLLLFNCMTREMLLFSPEEAAHIEEFTDELIKKWFLVPREQDDRALCDGLVKTLLSLAPHDGRMTSFTIFTTTDCNARCFYCYQAGRRHVKMTPETALRTAAFIKEKSRGERVRLTWTGGEPLCNTEAIDIITAELSKAEVPFVSAMISNGYLMDEALVKRAVDKWNLKNIQITLDGTKETYNNTKAYIYEDADAFERVLGNIGLLLDAGVYVAVRLPSLRANAADLKQLMDMLAARFGARKGFLAYVATITEHIRPELGERGFEVTDASSGAHVELNEHALKLGIAFQKPLEERLRLTRCMADNERGTTILPDGALGRCMHFTEEERYGSIFSDERDEALLLDWRRRIERGPQCENCPMYPGCAKLKRCPGDRLCRPGTERERLEQFKKHIEYTYELCRLNKAGPTADGSGSPQFDEC